MIGPKISIAAPDFDELTARIDAFDLEFLRAMQRVMRQVAGELGDVRIAAADPEEVPPPPGEAFVSLDDLLLIASLWGSEVATSLLPHLATAWVAGGAFISVELAAVLGERRDIPDPDIDLAREYLATAQNRMVRFSDTLWQVARDQLVEGFEQGESIAELRDRLMASVGITAPRASAVARTEVVSASNAGSMSMVEQMGFTGKKSWLATEDARTRPDHVLADGQTVAIEDSFLVGGAALFFPGDPSGPPEQIINCRCTQTYELDADDFLDAEVVDDDQDDEDEVFEVEDADVTAALSPGDSEVYVMVIPEAPPAEWFEEPPADLISENVLTVTDEGRIYGWVAPPGALHRSYSKDVPVPSGNVDYSSYLGRRAVVAGGGQIAAGVLTMDCGHAPVSPAFRDPSAAADHYDNTCSMVASVNVGEKKTRDGVGTWMAGSLLSGLTASQIQRIRMSAVSGDWRPSKKKRGFYEFVAALLVPVPGFAMTASAAAEEDEQGHLRTMVPVVLASAEAACSCGGDCGSCQEPEPETQESAGYREHVQLLLAAVHPELCAEVETLRTLVHDAPAE